MSSPAASPVAPPDTPNVRSFDYARAHALCIEKARRNIVRLAARPTAAPWAIDGNYFEHPEGFFEIGNWTSSFHTGMALRAFESTRDGFFLQQVNRLADAYREKITRARMDTMHDLGFLYSLYSVALHRLTRDPHHRRTGLRAADELAKRFRASGGYLQAWGRMDDRASDYAGLAIVDTLMNLPLLFWATRETSHPFYQEIAVRHAKTARAHFLRADDSVLHGFRFDVATGAPLRPDSRAGAHGNSQWSRGTAWAMYGFALAHRHTRDATFLDASARIARRFISALDDELIPPWDFEQAETPVPLRDSSAAAIAVCGLDELLVHHADPAFALMAEKLLGRLCADDLLDANLDCAGTLRHAQVGDGPGRAKNVYGVWGDYFFMEALARRQHATISFW